MDCLLAYEPEIPGIFGGVGIRNAHFANVCKVHVLIALKTPSDRDNTKGFSCGQTCIQNFPHFHRKPETRILMLNHYCHFGRAQRSRNPDSR